LVADADAAIADEDDGALRRAAHTIKSNAATFGLVRLSETAALLEKATQEQDSAVYAPLLARVKQNVTESVTNLSNADLNFD